MRYSRMISLVNCHCGGEMGDVIVGGVLDVPASVPIATFYDKLKYFSTKEEDLRLLLLNEPRGRPQRNVNLILPACDPHADVGFLIMESTEYAPMSGSNAICTATVLLETGMIRMQEPVTKLALDTAAGLVTITADCRDGKCEAIAFDNVPSFVFALDLVIDVPGLGKITYDVAWGGVTYAIVDVKQIGLTIEPDKAETLVEYGERIKKAIQANYTPIHPENANIKGVTAVEFTEPLQDHSGGKRAVNTVVVSPGRVDRSPCGTGTCARMAVLHKRGLLREGDSFLHVSIAGSEFQCKITGTTKVGEFAAISPRVKGSAWITGTQQVMLDPTDPFPVGFRLSDQWHNSKSA
ncbi:putative Proline racemase [Seiridium unicorne]|uniref:Proline racemase n=1 Tax=Seiridium unicorne TaxID=138068 RepID=A0ABR2URA7_9PEZI